jgi:hypothetical protein
MAIPVPPPRAAARFRWFRTRSRDPSEASTAESLWRPSRAVILVTTWPSTGIVAPFSKTTMSGGLMRFVDVQPAGRKMHAIIGRIRIDVDYLPPSWSIAGTYPAPSANGMTGLNSSRPRSGHRPDSTHKGVPDIIARPHATLHLRRDVRERDTWPRCAARALCVLIVLIAACYGPVHRAMRLSPIAALRGD